MGADVVAVREVTQKALPELKEQIAKILEELTGGQDPASKPCRYPDELLLPDATESFAQLEMSIDSPTALMRLFG
jgi:hypothetical protein